MPGELRRAFSDGMAFDASAIAGFGGAVLRDAPEVWRTVSADWASVLPESVFNMNVQAAIERVEEEDTPYL